MHARTFLSLLVSFFDNFQGNLLMTLPAPAQRLHACLVDLALTIGASSPGTEGGGHASISSWDSSGL